MKAHERVVSGLSCADVLARLSDFVDDQLDAASREQVLAHLKDCDTCERFGGRFSSVVAALRRELREPEPLSSSAAERLREALEKN